MTVLEQANASGGDAPRRRTQRAGAARAVADLLGRIEAGDDDAMAVLPFVDEADAPVVVEGLLARAFEAGCCPDRRTRLASMAAALGDGASTAATLLEQLRDADEDVRVTAATALGGRGNTRGVPALVGAVTDDSPRVRAAAVRALYDIGGAEAGAALASLLDQDVLDEELLRLALCGLRAAEEERAEPTLRRHLHHERPEVRLTALSALRDLRALAETEPVRGLLTDDDVRVRLLALSVLERHGARADADAVRERLSDADARVRAMARDVARALAADA